MTRRCGPLLTIALGLAGACRTGLAPLPMPLGLAPGTLQEARAWADSTRPSDNRDIRFRWQFQDQHGSAAGGRGRVQLALPDSVRLSAAGPLGSGHLDAVIAGDSGLWAEPEDEVQKLVPNYPLFWAMLGIARTPAPGSTVRRFSDARVTAWQFALGQDTVEYVRENGAAPRLLAEVRQGGARLGRVETRLSPEGQPVSARLTVLRPASRLNLTFYQNAKARPFAPEIWTRPAPPDR